MPAMTAVGVIPARYAARRFPGKPLALVAGRPLLRRVWEAAQEAKSLRAVIVATDDERIARVARGFGAEVALTRPDHPSGTDRLAEVALGLEDEIVVNVQGDEPLLEGFAIDALVEALEGDPSAPMATLVHPAEAGADADPNRVKVVLDQRGFALYFSRAAIPARPAAAAAGDAPPLLWQHVGVYAYRRPFLLELVRLAPTPLERAEGLEQLRALEHGHRIRCAVLERWRGIPVDVPEDVARVEARLRELGRS
jgi:3-deoxy-manno-octulosonate cytidylyltransferase (CMP-KDO synthetase)